MFPKKNFWIVLITFVVVISAGYIYYNNVYKPATAEPETPPVQTAVARRGDLSIFTSGAGRVVPATEIALGFPESGVLTELLVKLGDEVKERQILARMKTKETPESLAVSLADAELNAIKVQQELDAIYETAEMDTALALQAVESAQQALEDLNNPELQQALALQAISEAEETVKDAERALYNTQSTASQADIDTAYVQVLLAENALSKAQERYGPYANKPEDNLRRAQLLSQLSAAQQAYDATVRTYNAMTSTGDEAGRAVAVLELATAQAQLVEAQRGWERVKDGPSPGEMALAEAQLTAALAEWERLKDGPDPDEISFAEAQLASALAKLALTQEAKAVIDLTAPIDGTVLDISTSIGENVGTNPIIILADLSQPLLEVYLDETDLDKVAVDLDVEVVFDALPDEMFIGHVIEVNPSLVTVSGVQVVSALVRLDETSFAKPQTLPVGLNAAVDVIGGMAESAVLIPVEALRELGPDEYAVFVMEDGEPRLRVVTVGLVDFTSAEILTGIEPGEVVTTGIVETE